MLVTEDVTDARELFQTFLQFEGFDVVLASNGAEAVERAQETRPDAIVMDLSMPVMDGYTAAEALRADIRTRDIPLVALSGHVLPQHTEKAREAGCDTILPKPCALNDVAAKIRTLLHTSKPKQ